MDHFELFGAVLSSEDNAISFLKKFGIFNRETLPCKGTKGIPCAGIMRIKRRKLKSNTKSSCYICPKWRCRTSRTLRETNSFFNQRDKNGKSRNNLSLVQIIHFIYEWLYSRNTIEQAMQKTGLAKTTVIKWNRRCRTVCSKVLARQPKYIGSPEYPIQIDEAYFAGRRKYKKGRLRKGDIKPKGEDQAVKEENEGRVMTPYTVESSIQNKRNYGNRVIGPWVFGIYKSKERVRFFVIPDRKGKTLIPIIKRHVVPYSIVVSDEWTGYSRLGENNYVHKTVCHKRNFVNPKTGYHTQAIERAWIEGKAVIKRARYPTVDLQSHLDEVSWRMLRKNHNEGLFAAFLRDIKDCFTEYIF